MAKTHLTSISFLCNNIRSDTTCKLFTTSFTRKLYDSSAMRSTIQILGNTHLFDVSISRVKLFANLKSSPQEGQVSFSCKNK